MVIKIKTKAKTNKKDLDEAKNINIMDKNTREMM